MKKGDVQILILIFIFGSDDFLRYVFGQQTLLSSNHLLTPLTRLLVQPTDSTMMAISQKATTIIVSTPVYGILRSSSTQTLTVTPEPEPTPTIKVKLTPYPQPTSGLSTGVRPEPVKSVSPEPTAEPSHSVSPEPNINASLSFPEGEPATRTPTAEPKGEPETDPESEPEQGIVFGIFGGVASLLVISTIAFAYLYFRSKKRLQTLSFRRGKVSPFEEEVAP